MSELFNTPFVEPVSPELFTASLGAGWGAGLRPGSKKKKNGNKKPRQITLANSRAPELVLKFVIAPSICDVDTIHFSGNTVLVLTLTVQ